MVRRQVRNPLYPFALCTPCCSHFLLSPIFLCLQNQRFMMSNAGNTEWREKTVQVCLWARKHFEPFHLMSACPTLLRHREILVGGRGLRVIGMDSWMSVPSISWTHYPLSEGGKMCWHVYHCFFQWMGKINNCTSIEEEAFRS